MAIINLSLSMKERAANVPNRVLARMAMTGIYLLHGIPRQVQQASRLRAVRENTTLRMVLLQALNEYAAGVWPPRKNKLRQNDLFRTRA
jgi:hypothetical protein